MFALGLLSAAFAATVETPHKGGQLTLALSAEPKTLDPLKAADEPSGIVRYLTGGVLIRLNRQTQRLEPELALSWTNLENGKRIAFRLRPGVQFSDGSPFRAKDVCFTFNRLMDPALDSPFSDNFEMSKGKTLVPGGHRHVRDANVPGAHRSSRAPLRRRAHAIVYCPKDGDRGARAISS